MINKNQSVQIVSSSDNLVQDIANCPFCGSSNIVFFNKNKNCTISCCQCKCNGPIIHTKESNDKSNALKAWNKRVFFNIVIQ